MSPCIRVKSKPLAGSRRAALLQSITWALDMRVPIFRLTRQALHRYYSAPPSPIATINRTRGMSILSAVDKLPAPVKDLVLKATNNGADLVGETEADQASVNGWIERAAGEVAQLKVRVLHFKNYLL